MLVLSSRDLEQLLTIQEVIAVVEEGFRATARGETIVPERLQLVVPPQPAPAHDSTGELETGGVLLEMPSCITGNDARMTGALGTKIVSVFPANAARQLDSVQAAYLLLDAETGAPLALMDGRFLTGLRTAAASAVATRYMAGTGPKRLSIFGAGVQGRFHVDAMLAVADVERVQISSRSVEHAQSLAGFIRERYSLECDIAGPETAVADSNLICTCTTSASPLFDGNLLAEGTHINAVGSFTPATRELDTQAVSRAWVIIDHETAAGREAGEIMIPLSRGEISTDHVRGTLADVVSSRVPGRQSPGQITLFKSCGFAIEDLVTARLAYEKARESRMGQDVQL
jgi:ornithine cyclodeaminase